MRADIQSYLPDDLLVKTDMASMAHALELRSPFLDHIFMERVAAMPEHFKLAGRTSKYLLKEIAKDFLPPELLAQPKQGFAAPTGLWLRGSLESFTREHLFDPAFLNYGFNRQAIEHLFARHARGEDVSRKLWALLMLRFWLSSWH
jgi:asparagine synthase (glutamine-hydrolysing)